MKTTYQDYEPGYQKADLDNAFMNDWVFHYNIFTRTWAAVPRDLYQQYWSDYNTPGILRSSQLDTLIDLLHRSKGDMKIIKDLVKGEH